MCIIVGEKLFVSIYEHSLIHSSTLTYTTFSDSSRTQSHSLSHPLTHIPTTYSTNQSANILQLTRSLAQSLWYSLCHTAVYYADDPFCYPDCGDSHRNHFISSVIQLNSLLHSLPLSLTHSLTHSDLNQRRTYSLSQEHRVRHNSLTHLNCPECCNFWQRLDCEETKNCKKLNIDSYSSLLSGINI
jgi:hypothetical protein